MLYFEEGRIVASSGHVTVYKYGRDTYLEIGPGHNLWAISSEIKEYIRQLRKIPYGDCLEVGLGLGIVSNYLLSLPKVKSLTTIEISKDITEVYRQLLVLNENDGDIRHTIMIGDVHEVLPTIISKLNKKFDFIFFDHYSLIDEDTIDDLSLLLPIATSMLKDDGIVMGWFDPYTPQEFAEQFYKLFDN